MAYPRRCPLCGADYRRDKAHDLHHTTLSAEPGGTPNPRRPTLPGRLLTLRCLACRGEYTWDYFAEHPPVAGGRYGRGGTAMADRRGADPEVGARVRMKATGRAGTIREVVETRARTLYYVVHDHASGEEAVPLAGEPAAEFGTYAAADTFDVLP